MIPKNLNARDMRVASQEILLAAIVIRPLPDLEEVPVLEFGCGQNAHTSPWLLSRRQRIGARIVDPRHDAGCAALLRHSAGRQRLRCRA